MSAVLIRLSAEGSASLTSAQQRWELTVAPDEEHAYFGGQVMRLAPDSSFPGTFKLEYLGFMSIGFPDRNTAKSLARDFSLTVLKRLTALITSAALT